MTDWRSWLLFGVIYLSGIGLPAALSFITPSYLLYGLYVPEEEREDVRVLGLRKRMRLWVMSILLISLAAGVLIGLLPGGTEEWALGVSFIIALAGLVICWRSGRKQALRLKAERKWQPPSADTGKRVIDLGFRQRLHLIGSRWYLLHLAIIIIGVAAAILLWDRIPDRLTTHFNIDGTPDGFSNKSFGSVFDLNIIQLVMTGIFVSINSMIRSARQQLDPVNPAKSVDQQIRFRRANSYFLYYLSLYIVALFGGIQASIIFEWPQSIMLGIGISTPIIILVGLIAFVVYLTKKDNLFDAGRSPVTKDDSLWRAGGIFYYNKQDPSLMVEKRYGMGWTLNMARPLGWVILGSILIVPTLIIVIVAVAGG